MVLQPISSAEHHCQVGALWGAQVKDQEHQTRSEKGWGEIRKKLTWAGNCLGEKNAGVQLPQDNTQSLGCRARSLCCPGASPGLGSGCRRIGVPYFPTLSAILPPEGWHGKKVWDPVSSLKKAFTQKTHHFALVLQSWCPAHVLKTTFFTPLVTFTPKVTPRQGFSVVL